MANYKPASGGISTQIDMLSRYLEKDDYKTGILSLKGNVGHRVMSVLKLFKIGRKYDVFHIHACSDWGFLPAVIGITIGKLFKKKIVLTFHGGNGERFFDKHPNLVKSFLNKTDCNIVPSGFLEKVFAKYSLPCVVVSNIIEVHTAIYHKRNRISPKFISIRSFTPTYNILCTIKAFKQVKDSYPEATLTLLGDGPLRMELESYVASESIKDISFVGLVPNDQIYKYLNEADIMLSSPLVDNMPISLLEGFDAGLLVVSSNVGGVPYIVEDGQNGLLFESDNEQQMAEKILWALNNETAALKIMQHANQSVRKYTWESIGKQMKEIYG